MGQELDYVILICNSSVVLSQMFSGGPDLGDADLGASQIWYQCNNRKIYKYESVKKKKYFYLIYKVRNIKLNSKIYTVRIFDDG